MFASDALGVRRRRRQLQLDVPAVGRSVKWAALLGEHGYARDDVRACAPKLLHISADAHNFGATLENANI